MIHYNKSKIMKLAHHMRKHEGFTMSQALTLAWSKAKRDEFYMIIVTRKPVRRIHSVEIMIGASEYYASKVSGVYTGD